MAGAGSSSDQAAQDRALSWPEPQGPWLAGKDYSLADIHMLSIVHRFRELYPDLLAPDDYPRVTDWRDRIMARPAVAWVYSSDTEEVPGRPSGKSISGIG